MEEEDQILQDYMKHVAAEAWAIPNKRLQKYVQEESNRPRHCFDKKDLNTAINLRFTN